MVEVALPLGFYGISFWAVVALAVGGVGAWFAGRLLLRKIRTDKMARFAAEMGFEFLGRDDELVYEYDADFRLMDLTVLQRVHNAMVGTVMDLDLQVYDFAYDRWRTSIGGSQSRNTKWQTVIALAAPDVDLPQFSIDPDRALASAEEGEPRMPEVELPTYPDFTSRCAVRGEMPERVRELLTPSFIEHIERDNLRWQIEGGGEWVIFYGLGRTIPVDGIRSAIDEVAAIFMELEVNRFVVTEKTLNAGD